MIKRAVLWLIYTAICRVIINVILGVRFVNRGVLKTSEQFVVVANHNSHLDSVSILCAMPSAKLIKTKPIAAGDYFGNTPFKAWLTRFFINAVLIPRKRPEPGDVGPDPIQLIIEEIDKGNSLIIFPEGTRGLPDKMQKFKRGIGLVLAERPHVAVISAYFKGIGRVLPKGELLPIPFNTTLEFGEPFFVTNKTPESISAEIEEKVRVLKDRIETIKV